MYLRPYRVVKMAVRANIVTVVLLLFIKFYITQGLTIRIEAHSDGQQNQNCFNQTTCSVNIHHLLANAHQLIQSNTTLLFQAEHYEVNTPFGNILITNVNNLNITGAMQENNGKVTIVCSEQFGLTFVNVVNLTLQNIHFIRCDSNFSQETIETISKHIVLCDHETSNQITFCDIPISIARSTITVISSTKVILENLWIKQTTGIALLAINIYTKLTIEGNDLSNNTVNCLIATVPPLVSFSWYTSLEKYEIGNTVLRFGNITDNEQQSLLSSGLNILWRDLYYRHIQVTISNITTEDNICIRGNVLFDINVCDEAQTFFIIKQLTSRYSSKTESKYTRGIVIVGASYRVCTNLYSDLVSIYFIFEDSVLDNSTFSVLVQRHDRLKTYIEVHLKRFSIYYTQGDTRGPYSMKISPANVTLSDFQLVNSSNILIADSTLKIKGQSFFTGNTGVLQLINTTLYLIGNTIIRNNLIVPSTFSMIQLINSTVKFEGNTLIEKNTAELSVCVAASFGSVLKITGSVTFNNNRGYNGGALALYKGSHIIIEQSPKINTSLRFIGNKAQSYGGAVYIEDYHTEIRTLYGYTTVIPCWLRIKMNSVYQAIDLVFKDNKAGQAGDSVFGGWIQYCYVSANYYNSTVVTKSFIRSRTSLSNEHSLISSTPIRVCMCQDSVTNCNKTIIFFRLPPGKSFTIEAVAVGQEFGIVPSLVTARVAADVNVMDNELYQNFGKRCTKLSYTVSFKTLDGIGGIQLKVERFSFIDKIQLRNPNVVLFDDLYISLLSTPCPKGYKFNNLTKICECNQILEKNGLNCDIQTGTVTRSKEWVNSTSFHTGSTSSLEQGVIVHKHCPFDYCDQKMTHVDLEYPDTQCQYNRSGTLCGGCKQNFSTIFGSSSCLKCTNTWALLIVPIVVLAGIGLVFALTLLNLTISFGTFSGLIFYANIVRANQSIFFSQGSTNTFLSWFIAWLNLDIGFEVCFYNGLDIYTKTWLQFVFPMYVWLLVLTIIVSSHYSTRAARLTGNNAVQVLATLFLLSYTKLLRVTIVALSFTTLKYPDGYVQKVWLYDGNVDYLQGKHIALFLAALLVLSFVSIPYTVILVTIQWLQRYTQYTLLKWVTKFLPLFEAYTGPYKIKHRYWPGLLLLVRVLSFLIFSLNIVGDPAINLLAITVTMICILTYSAYLGGVYKLWQLDTLEYSFYVNLGILSTATLYNINSGGNQSQLVFTSTGITFVTFCFIVFYHAYMRLSTTAKGKKIITCITLKIKGPKQKMDDKDEDNTDPQSTSVSLPTRSIVELHEPLLDT